MKLILIAALVAISVAVPAVFLSGSPYTTSNSLVAIPAERGAVQEVGAVSPQEPRPEVVNEPPKKALILPLPEQGRIAEPPKEEVIVQPPQPALVAQPPQQPVQEPRIPPVQQVPTIEVRPQGYVFKGAMLSLFRAQWEGEWGGREGDVVRAQLTDAHLTPFLQLKGLHRDANRTMSLKQALEEIDVRTRDILSQCSPVNREIGRCPERPTMYLELNEDQTIALVNLVNPDLSSGVWFRERTLPNGTLERYWGAVITFNGIRYLLSIGSVWGPQ